MTSTRRKIYFADLTHTAQGISAATFPLGVSYVVAYAQKELGSDFDFELFKFPEVLEKRLRAEPPAMLCFSNYSWNLELAYKMAELAKKHIPGIIIVFGGPNFPLVDTERQEYLAARPAMDFYIQLEGEIGFVDLVRKLMNHGFSVEKLKQAGEQVLNTAYLVDGQLISGPVERIRDVNIIPSPYLTGILDSFFDLPLVPMFETTRGCPFTCSFCSDGLLVKSKISRYTDGRVQQELTYIADRVKSSDEIIVTDLNFGMYEQDMETCRSIAQLQATRGWPVLVKGSAGKNRQDRILAAADILKGSWVIGASIQSTDPDVLKAVKRSNISSKAFQSFIDYFNNLGSSQTYSEIILGLPADTKEKHFESLNFGIKNSVNSMRMFQAMLLCGTEMASEASRKEYELQTRFRTIPGCVGVYEFFGEKHPVVEIEEIVVGNKTMPFNDYIECRIMNLIVETFYNNAVFEEVFSLLRKINVPVFDCLLQIKNHPERYGERINEILKDFVHQTSKDLYTSLEEAKKVVLTEEVIDKYIDGELGINELLVCKAALFVEFEQIARLTFQAAKECIRNAGLLTPVMETYLLELERFVLLRKKDALKPSEQVFEGRFNFDFKAIAEMGFSVDPNESGALRRPADYVFFQDESQRKHLSQQLAIYSSTPMGLGRLIQRSNLKLIYRRFEPTETASLRDEFVA